jgi:putative flippase GtrA
MALTSRLGRPGTSSSGRQGLYARAAATARQKKKFLRYTATSVVAVVVSETTLLLYGTSTLNATADAFIANLAGILPSYLLTRY